MTAWRQGNPPPGNGKVFGVPAPRRDGLRDELQCGQIHGAGTDSVQDQSIFPESVENQPPGEMFDPPGADARILQIGRSEEHTSELQSLRHLVCRLLLE